MTRSLPGGRTLLLATLGAILVLELSIAGLAHRDGTEQVRVAREGSTRSRLAAVHKLARRDDGSALQGGTLERIVEDRNPDLLAFVLLAQPRDLLFARHAKRNAGCEQHARHETRDHPLAHRASSSTSLGLGAHRAQNA